MNGMEKKLKAYEAQEARTAELAQECRESAEKAFLERDQAKAAEQYLRVELERLREVPLNS